MTATTVDTGGRADPRAAFSGFVRREAWVIGLFCLLILLFVFTKLIQPNYGPAGFRGLAVNTLPLALAAVGQAIVVISGGIDLSVGSMIALTSSVAASQMLGASTEYSIVVAIGVSLLGLLIGAINGLVIVLTRVADIIVTLAMSFVWAGTALLVLNVPGGRAAPWLIAGEAVAAEAGSPT